MIACDLTRVAAVIKQATAENTKVAYRKDLSYFWAWAAAAMCADPAHPVAAEVLVKFIADHAGAMDTAVDQALVDAGVKQRLGAHSASTITRRIHGGRRRSEVATARVEHLTAAADGYMFYPEASKTDQEAAGEQKPLVGKAGKALADWLAAAGITEGFLFRAITKGGKAFYKC